MLFSLLFFGFCFLDPTHQNHLLATLLLLVPLLNPKPVCNRKPVKSKKCYKPSKCEIEEAFITFVEQDNDIPTVIQERKERYQRFDITLQPLLILVGDLQEVKKSKVVVDGHMYDTSSGIDAVDVVFKIIHATNTCYPKEAEGIWMFIQIAFYHITTKYDKMFSSN